MRCTIVFQLFGIVDIGIFFYKLGFEKINTPHILEMGVLLFVETLDRKSWLTSRSWLSDELRTPALLIDLDRGSRSLRSMRVRTQVVDM